MNRNPKYVRVLTLLAIAAGLLIPAANAQKRPAAPKSVRIYIFDGGIIKGLDPGMFHLKKEELAESNFVVVSYLIVHPKGTLMWDTGTVPDSAFKPDGSPVTQGIMTVNKPLLPQLAAIGYTPADITYLGLSHYHSDHTANANAFAGSTWLVHQTERDFMFSDAPKGIIQPAGFSALKTAKTKILPDDDYDVFGDGTVVIKYAPGHTQGHQVLFVKLAKTGPVLLAGDLYHYPEERNTDKTPTFEFNHDQSLASRAAIEAFLKKTGAQLWIEHDMPTFNKQKKSPEFYE
ncbi:MAG TPA: N-acyl homoserine lactonase family protein [Bryobacteraceae bacterium]|jgi:glyoxylase-like metal-dependent hydrolase (beta-lactamase superfamily II)|nr:N-acyl homoserine lactonase family protein [Bryobacteraceae bacterium]